MTNRIKQLRKESKMTQAELAKKLGVSPQAVGAYERGSRKVSPKILGKLAEIFNKSAGYIAGEPTEDDVIRFLMDYYNEKDHDRIFWQARGFPWSLWGRLNNYFIGNGIVSYDVPSTTRLLSEDQANDFNFWKKQFSWLIDGESYKYLKDSCKAVSESAFTAILATTIAANNEVQVYPDVQYKDSSNSEWVVKNSEFIERIIKRRKFLNANLVPNDEPDFIDPYGKPHFGWSFTWELGLPVKDIN
ncbi:helix-turn-helix transcriptional regulator [Lactobacillus delbrueckii]|uniref:helix-turn-helix transcriptional regulator n=1 Tax=Lactobacillus delbrueckii TaxID=1584 RepID=UPI0022AF600A|nr:helix-turn-helix transcriptional regulator [Lactobacillus delbrueckii]